MITQIVTSEGEGRGQPMISREDLARAVRAGIQSRETNAGDGLGIMAENRAWLEVESMLAEILDSPDEQPEAVSAFVNIMRRVANRIQDNGHGMIDKTSIVRWADTLEAAERESKERGKIIAEQGARYISGINEYQAKLEAAERRCEDYRDAAVAWKNRIAELEKQLADTEDDRDHYRELIRRASLAERAKPAAEVDWDAMGEFLRALRHEYSWTSSAEKLIAAYEASRPKEFVAALVKTESAVVHGFGSRVDARAFWDDRNSNGACEYQAVKVWHYHPATEDKSDGE